jgi:uncharacterized protein YprB with RNaseH-like and TPR domain
MLSQDLRSRLSALWRGQPSAVSRHPAADHGLAAARSEWVGCFPEAVPRQTDRGELLVCDVALRDIRWAAQRMTERYLAAFERAAHLAASGSLPPHLEPLASATPESAALIDTETAGFYGRPLFLVGTATYSAGDIRLTQYFAADYGQEAAVLSELARLLDGVALLISFNGKAFDWPFVRDRMVYHRLTCQASFRHLDLLHLSRRRWRSRLPDCKLRTLERYLCGRCRSGDIRSDEIPQRYHEFVRWQDPRLIAPVFHHNRLDIITMIELLPALLGVAETAMEGA